jgi:hypothetical protein
LCSGIDHHQVAGDAAPGPDAQGLRQRAQQAQALCRAGGHEHDRPIAGDAEAPQQAPVADLAGRAFGALGGRARPRQAGHQCGAQRLDGREVVGTDAQCAQPDARQRG